MTALDIYHEVLDQNRRSRGGLSCKYLIVNLKRILLDLRVG